MSIQSRLRLFTVHENTLLLDEDRRIVLVKEGFCWPAFVLGLSWLSFLWLAYHRMWLASVLYIGLLFAIALGTEAIGLPETAVSIVTLGVALLIGFEGNAIRRLWLGRKGYRELGVVGGTDLDEAERAYFEEAGTPAVPKPSPVAAAQTHAATPAWGPPKQQDEVLGLFPKPGGR